MKILHISGAKGWGGNEQQIISLLPKLQKQNVNNLVFGLSDSVLEKECLANGIDFVGVKSNKLNKFKNLKPLKNIINEFQPAIVQLHTSDSLMYFILAATFYKFKTKLIFSKKGIGGSSSKLSKFKYNSTKISSIFCVSKSVQDSFSSILNQQTKDKTVVINDCVSMSLLKQEPTVDIKSLFAVPNHIKLVGNIANHTTAKDLYTLVDVLHQIVHVKNRKDVYFIQIGEFSKRTNKIKAYATQRGVAKQLVFLDKYTNAALLNPQFDCFLLTSEREGGPTSVLEAMLLETPVVSTKVGFVNAFIKDGVNGFVAPIKDYKTLANGVLNVLDNADLQQQFVQKNKAIIEENFSAEKIAEITLGHYKRILKT